MAAAAGAGSAGGGALLTEFQYCVIIQHPKRSTQAANADAVAATIVNAVYSTLGPRQTVIQAMDLRTPLYKSHVDRFLAERGLAGAYSTTPLFYSRSGNLFAKPGLVSLQLLINAAAYLLRFPTPEIVSMILAFPQRHSLEFSVEWADRLEESESAEGKMKATPNALPRHSVNISDRILENGRITSSPQERTSLTTDPHAGAQYEAMNVIRDSFGADSIGEVVNMGSVTGTDTVFYTGMSTYADASVYARMQADVEPASATSAKPDVSAEQLLSARIGGLLNGKDTISQTALSGKVRTDAKSMEQEIQNVRRARVQQTREFRKR